MANNSMQTMIDAIEHRDRLLSEFGDLTDLIGGHIQAAIDLLESDDAVGAKARLRRALDGIDVIMVSERARRKRIAGS